MNEKMFCYQCQETAGCKGCTMVGVCGKQPDVAVMQDLLVWVTKGLSAVTTALREQGKAVPADINHLITLNLFTTITNANFDRADIEARITATLDAKRELLAQLGDASALPEAARWDGEGDWMAKARTVGVLSTADEDIRSLRELITYGLKGLSAYSKHANALLQDDAEVDAIKAGFSSGVAFAVSVHIRDAEDLVHKSIIKKLYLTGEFDYVVLLEEYGDTFSVVDLRGGGDEDPWTVDDRTFLRGDRYFTGS